MGQSDQRTRENKFSSFYFICLFHLLIIRDQHEAKLHFYLVFGSINDVLFMARRQESCKLFIVVPKQVAD